MEQRSVRSDSNGYYSHPRERGIKPRQTRCATQLQRHVSCPLISGSRRLSTSPSLPDNPTREAYITHRRATPSSAPKLQRRPDGFERNWTTQVRPLLSTNIRSAHSDHVRPISDGLSDLNTHYLKEQVTPAQGQDDKEQTACSREEEDGKRQRQGFERQERDRRFWRP